MKQEDKVLLKSFGKNLKTQRRRKGLTQEQLGDIAKVNYKYIGEIERGLKNPTARIIQKLADALDVRLCEIASARACSQITRKVYMDIVRILYGKKEHEQQKALKILEVFLRIDTRN